MTVPVAAWREADLRRQLDMALKLWLNFGGIGGRTRRGLGAVFTDDSRFALSNEVGLRSLVPTISNATLFWYRTASPPLAAWATAVGELQKFRQTSCRGAMHKKNGRDVPGRSRWPEPDSIRHISGCALQASPPGTIADVDTHNHSVPIDPAAQLPLFPRALLGLPIIFHFAPGDGQSSTSKLNAHKDPADATITPIVMDSNGVDVTAERLASPIVTRPVYIGKAWYPAALILRTSQLKVLALHYQGMGELLPWELETIGSAPTDFRCTNIILATVSTERAQVNNMQQWADAARRCVQHRWQEFCDSAYAVAKQDIQDAQWIFQSANNDVLETYIGWTPLGPNYRQARQTVVRMLSGRKVLRDFGSWNFNSASRLPKSSLDARRETVLKKPQDRQGALHFRPKEELDIVGIVKRADFGKDAIRYPSVSRIAVDPWLQGAIATEADLSVIRQVCAALAQEPLRVLTKRSNRQANDQEDDFHKFPWFKDFPFEGTPIYRTRHAELLKEAFHLSGPERPERRDGRLDRDAYENWRSKHPDAERLRGDAERQLGEIRNAMRSLTKNLGQPSPYFVVLKADGDHVGGAISRLAQLDSADIHRVFSLSQSKFAKRAQEVINGARSVPSDPTSKVKSGTFHGAAVYTGGDDVLCFVPIHQCLQLARWLHAEFARMIVNTIEQSGLRDIDKQRMKSTLDEVPPTLSVGISVGHFLEPLEDLLTYADEAEQRAKNPDSILDQRQSSRNGFAITDHPRGGASIGVRGNWDESHSLIDRLEAWQELYIQDEIPSKAPYELRECARAFDNQWKSPPARIEAMRLVAGRIFARKTARTVVKGTLQLLHSRIQAVQTPADLETLACELLIAAHLAFAQQQSVGLGKSFGYGAFA